ncbi:hypothetical protein FocTR4_00000811 [Fusarium oxysporum f. sp. cubense]|uniref:Uncharacterized protein n=1 Tax=Fusarium oxysporum f. sp. cubense TaxID=61366 RepID=A0A5C6T339_FUSOC|nr:hypothetical protein FocTR4_00000811 [Fusarium oxysporum f. sp. cubense]
MLHRLIALDASARNALTWELCLYQPDREAMGVTKALGLVDDLKHCLFKASSTGLSMTQYTFFTNSLTKLHVPLAGARSTFPSLSKRLNPFTDFYNLPLQVVHQASQVAVPPYSVATRSQGPINSLGG